MVGKVTSEGVRAMSADSARLLFGLDGSGIKIGVISDSFNARKGAAADVRSGDLPGSKNPNGYRKPVKVLKDRADSTDEGRAMLQIIHDIAPGATLLFHRGPDLDDEAAMVQAINALAKAGANVIVDDVGLIQPLFQDGVAAQAIDSVVKRGIVYVSAVGNAAGNSYQSEFRPSQTITINGKQYIPHDFDPGSGVDTTQSITFKTSSEPRRFVPYLQWNQPFETPTTDFDIFLFDQAGNLLVGPAAESDGQAISTLEKPYIIAANRPAQTVALVIGKPVTSSGPDPSLIKWLDVFDNPAAVEYRISSSTLDGHVNAEGTIAVGGSDIRTSPAFGRNGPRLQDFSSLGGTPIFFDINGKPLAQPQVRQKPEIVGPDGVSTTVPGFAPFNGTSAAAPHLAALAALLLQRAGGAKSLTPAQVRTILQATARTMDAQPNFTTGAGFALAEQAVLEAALSRKTASNTESTTIRGTKRADNLTGLAGDDRLNGLAGRDALLGRGGRDRLAGGDSNDLLVGGLGRDILIGGAGTDLLMGGLGVDRLTGNAGIDVFLFNENRPFSRQRPTVDTISDFRRNETIALSSLTFTIFENPPSALKAKNPVPIVPFGSHPSFQTVETVSEAQRSAAAILYDRQTGSIYYNPNGAKAGFGRGGEFAKVSAGLELSAENFEIVG